jgi:hypothetical protein
LLSVAPGQTSAPIAECFGLRCSPSEPEMGIKLANNAATTVPLAVSSSATSFTVATGAGVLFPALGATDYFYATLQDVNNNFEIVKVTARVDDVMTVVRAQEGTLAIPFPVNSRFELRVTAQNMLSAFSDLDFLLL